VLALLVVFALQRASVAVVLSIGIALAGMLFLSMAGEAVFEGNVPINFGGIIERQKSPFLFWLVVAALAVGGLLVLSKLF